MSKHSVEPATRQLDGGPIVDLARRAGSLLWLVTVWTFLPMAWLLQYVIVVPSIVIIRAVAIARSGQVTSEPLRDAERRSLLRPWFR